MKRVFTITITSIFILLTIVFFVLGKSIPAFGFPVLEAGNVLMAVLSFSSFAMVSRQEGRNGSAFVRGVSGASMLKLMVCLIAIVIYVAINRASIHKPTIFVLMGVYLVYSAAETALLSRMARTMK